MENKVDISLLISETSKFYNRIEWVDPRDVVGLPDKDEVLRLESIGEWDESLADDLNDYIEEWFELARIDKCFNEDSLKSPIERYVDAKLYIFVKYHNSPAALFTLDPEIISVEYAKKCINIFKNYLSDESLTESEKETIRMYLTDFYQIDDLWSSKEGRFYRDLSDSENSLLLALSQNK